MAGRKWNNQGGSNFDAFSGKYKKPKEQFNIPQFEDLKESNSTSFNYKVPPKPKPKLGTFGDEIWTYEVIDDASPIIDLTPKDPQVPSIRVATLPIPHVDPVNSSLNLLPTSVINEYELVVKFGSLVLRISSGQAYAARQGLNDSRYDFALVIKSSNPISIGGNTAATVNLISVSNSAQNPIYSLYNWLRTKISIATNNDATGADSVLSGIGIISNVAQLPSTQFVSNSFTYGLFYAEGIQPDQICLNAINQVFNFAPSVAANPTWVVTYPGEILPLCLDINHLQVVSIKLIPSTLNEIIRGSGGLFVIRVARDATISELANSLEVDIKITSPELLFLTQQLDHALYATTNINNVAIGQISAIIPSLAEYIDITIEPLSDPSRTDPVPLRIEIIGSNTPDSTPDYSINALFQEVNMIVNPVQLLPVVNIRIPVTTYSIFTIPDPTDLDLDGIPITIETVYTNVRSSIKQNEDSYTLRVSRSFATSSPLTVFVDLTASVGLTASIPVNHIVFFDSIAIGPLPIISGVVQLVIPANQLSIDYFFQVGANEFRYQSDQSASGSLISTASYDAGLDTIFDVIVLERQKFEYSSSVRSGGTFSGGSQQVTFIQPTRPNYILKFGYAGYTDFYSIFSSGYGLIPGLFAASDFIASTSASVTIVSNLSPPTYQQMIDNLALRGYINPGTITATYQSTSINTIFENYIEN